MRKRAAASRAGVKAAKPALAPSPKWPALQRFTWLLARCNSGADSSNFVFAAREPLTVTCLPPITHVSSCWGFVTAASWSEGHPAREHHHFARQQQTRLGVFASSAYGARDAEAALSLLGPQCLVTPVTLPSAPASCEMAC